MAYHKSAIKRAKQNVVRRERNKSYLSGVKTAIKKFRKSLDELKAGKIDAQGATALMNAAQSALGKAASKGLVHKNNASRNVSRMAQALAKITPKA
jgi:small subunit ribosomal protein S20